jgi:hypothetical protein
MPGNGKAVAHDNTYAILIPDKCAQNLKLLPSISILNTDYKMIYQPNSLYITRQTEKSSGTYSIINSFNINKYINIINIVIFSNN